MYDVIVVGAGCAGAPIGMLLGHRGYRVLVLDRARPRPESRRPSHITSAGLLLLDRWSLLDALAVAGCAESESTTFGWEGTAVEFQGRTCTTRPSILDGLLVDAARRAGAEVREGFTVKDVVWEHDRVCGVVGWGADQHAVCERGRIVVGADGRESLVARATAASVVREQASTGGFYCAYWRGVEVEQPEIHLARGAMVAVLPTPERLVGILVALPVDRWADYKRAPEGRYLRTLAEFPSIEERLEGAARESRFFGTAELGASVRQPIGPGWALVGDANRHAGGMSPEGVSHAFVQAALLAEAIDEGLSRRQDLADALGHYAGRCQELLSGVEAVTTTLSSGPPVEAVAGLLDELQAATSKQMAKLEALDRRGVVW